MVKLARHTYSSLFGTFLCNSERERELEGVRQTTYSVWSFLRAGNNLFRNYLYHVEEEEEEEEGVTVENGSKGTSPSPHDAERIANENNEINSDGGVASADTIASAASADKRRGRRSVLWPCYAMRSMVFWSSVYLGESPTTTSKPNQHASSPPPSPLHNNHAPNHKSSSSSSDSTVVLSLENGFASHFTPSSSKTPFRSSAPSSCSPSEVESVDTGSNRRNKSGGGSKNRRSHPLGRSGGFVDPPSGSSPSMSASTASSSAKMRSYDDIVSALETNQRGFGAASYIVGSPPSSSSHQFRALSSDASESAANGVVVVKKAFAPHSGIRSGSVPHLASSPASEKNAAASESPSSTAPNSLVVVDDVASFASTSPKLVVDDAASFSSTSPANSLATDDSVFSSVSAPRQIPPFSPLVSPYGDDLPDDNGVDGATVKTTCRCKSPVKGKSRCVHGKTISTKLSPEVFAMKSLRLKEDVEYCENGEEGSREVNGEESTAGIQALMENGTTTMTTTKPTTTTTTTTTEMNGNGPAEAPPSLQSSTHSGVAGESEDTLTRNSGHELLSLQRRSNDKGDGKDDEAAALKSSLPSATHVDVGTNTDQACIGNGNPFSFDVDGYDEQFRHCVGIGVENGVGEGHVHADSAAHSNGVGVEGHRLRLLQRRNKPNGNHNHQHHQPQDRQGPSYSSRESESSSSETQEVSRQLENGIAGNQRQRYTASSSQPSPTIRSPSALNCAVC